MCAGLVLGMLLTQASAPAMAARALALIPYPQVVSATPGCRLRLSAKRPLTVPSRIDPGGLDLVKDRLQTLHLPPPVIASAPTIRTRRLSGPAERYTLDVSSVQISVGASGGAGEMDALATLAQLIGQGGSRESIPCVRIQDQPALAWRFLSDDVARGQLPTMAYFATRIRRLASYKINGYSIYLENQVVRRGHESETRVDALTKAELTQLSELAARYHMAFVPEQESFSHLGALLAGARYRDVRENDRGDMISPATPATYDLLRDLFRSEFAGVPGIHLIHIGGDETYELGTGRSAALVRRQGYARVYAAHITRVTQIVKSLGARAMIWGDAIRRYPQILQGIPRSIVVVPFDYDVEASYDPLITPIQRAGFAQLVAPSVANFDRFFPDLPRATNNIGAFVGAAKRHKLLGMFVTVWMEAKDELYDATWYPVAFAAAQAWEPLGEGPTTFCPHFAQLSVGTSGACAAFEDFGRLDVDFGRDFPSDTPETLWYADWRVPYLAQRLKLTPAKLAVIAAHVSALRSEVAALNEDQDPHLVNAMRIAALRYSILLSLLEGERPNAALVKRAEQSHLAEWAYENRRLSTTDQITRRYDAFLPVQRVASDVGFLLPPMPASAPSAEVGSIESWFALHEPHAVDPGFLLADPVAYVATAAGIDPQVAAPIVKRLQAVRTVQTDHSVHVADRYLSAAVQRAMMAFVIRRQYDAMLSVTRRSNPASVFLPVARVLSELGLYEGALSDLQGIYAEQDGHSEAVLRALDLQRRSMRKMEDCFQTFVHEWMTYGGAPQTSKNDFRAHLPASLRAVFCEP